MGIGYIGTNKVFENTGWNELLANHTVILKVYGSSHHWSASVQNW